MKLRLFFLFAQYSSCIFATLLLVCGRSQCDNPTRSQVIILFPHSCSSNTRTRRAKSFCPYQPAWNPGEPTEHCCILARLKQSCTTWLWPEKVASMCVDEFEVFEFDLRNVANICEFVVPVRTTSRRSAACFCSLAFRAVYSCKGMWKKAMLGIL